MVVGDERGAEDDEALELRAWLKLRALRHRFAAQDERYLGTGRWTVRCVRMTPRLESLGYVL